ncbi:MAG: apolipoprotein N-acyltransferase [Thermoplasmata archaeon]|nr:apolipoprotein N-acyltransferase [Thermoplasmata archaeon]
MRKSSQPSAFSFQLVLAAASSSILILAFPNFNLWPLAWIAFVPLFFSIDGQKPLKSFLVSYLAGFLFFLGAVYWLIHVTLPGMIIVVMYLALYFGIFGLTMSFIMRRSKPLGILFFAPSAWVALELARSNVFSGFGWALLSHSQTPCLGVIQIADITGAYGVSFLVMMANAAVFLTIKELRKKVYSSPYLGIALALIFISLAYGMIRVKNIFTGEIFRVTIVQGNIPQARKWDASFRQEIAGKYERLTKDAAKEKADLIIWPETSVPGFLESERDLLGRVEALAKETKTPLLVGAPREDAASPDVYYNSAVLFDREGRISERYDKIHLVPFGEYLPFKGILSFVENFAPNPIGDFRGGKDHKVFSVFMERSFRDKDYARRLVKKVEFSCLICFEDIFPGLTREFVRSGANFLVNITNDAWFGNTSAPYQHAQSSVFRAVENRLNVVRAANTGLSCFIDQKGRIVKKVEGGGRDLFVDGFAVNDIVLTNTRTFYTVYGDIFAYACVLLAALYLFVNAFYIRR